MAQARKKPVVANAAVKSDKETVDATLKKTAPLRNEITRLQRANQRLDRELTLALNRNVRLQETIKVMSGLLTEIDAREIARRQLDDEIPF